MAKTKARRLAAGKTAAALTTGQRDAGVVLGDIVAAAAGFAASLRELLSRRALADAAATNRMAARIGTAGQLLCRRLELLRKVDTAAAGKGKNPATISMTHGLTHSLRESPYSLSGEKLDDARDCFDALESGVDRILHEFGLADLDFASHIEMGRIDESLVSAIELAAARAHNVAAAFMPHTPTKDGNGDAIRSEAISAWRLGDCQYEVGGEKLRLTFNEDAVLCTLMERGPLGKDDLREFSGVPHAYEVLARVERKYALLAPFIHRPGPSRRGGYRVTIVAAE